MQHIGKRVVVNTQGCLLFFFPKHNAIVDALTYVPLGLVWSCKVHKKLWKTCIVELSFMDAEYNHLAPIVKKTVKNVQTNNH
jgi:hypothetical protein